MNSSPPSTFRRPSARRHRLVLGSVAVPVALIGSMLGATAADAATFTVTTKADLVSRMNAAVNGDVITLGADLVGDSPNDVLTTPVGRPVTLDLNGYKLDLDFLQVADSATLFLSNSGGSGASLEIGGASVPVGTSATTGAQISSGARLEVGAGVRLGSTGSTGRPGIGTIANDDTSAQLGVDSGATVTAQGGSHGAGIGGGDGAAPLRTISIADATVTATGGDGGAGIGGGYANPTGSNLILIASTATGSVTATGGAGAAGIGGGMAGAGGVGGVGATNVSVSDGVVTVASGGLTSGAPAGTTPPSAIGIGQGAAGTAAAFGGFRNTFSGTAGARDSVTIADGSTLTVPSGKEITNSGTLVVRGRLTGAGTIKNWDGASRFGTITRAGSGVIDDAALTVTGRNFAVGLDSTGGTTTAPATQHVYAPTFGQAGLDLGAYTGSATGGRTLVGWSSGGTRATNDTVLSTLLTPDAESGAVPLTAAYERPIAFSRSALPNAATDRQYDVGPPTTGDASTFAASADPSGSLPVGTIPLLPSGLSVHPATGAITGRPTTAGHYSFVLTASSAYQRVAQAVTIDVAGAPVVATSALPDAKVGEEYRRAIIATTDTGSIAYALTRGTLPAGLHLDPTSGIVSGTPTEAGTFALTVAATNPFGTTEADVSLYVAGAGGSDGSGGAGGSGGSGGAGAGGTQAGAPVLPSLPTVVARLGHPLSLSVAASSTTPVTYAVRTKKLPKGLAFDRSSGLLFGAPRTPGRYVLHVTATNAAGSAKATYTVVVPKATRLVTGSADAVTPKSGKPVTVTIRGLLAGERWRIALDGHTVKRGVAKFGGRVRHTVALPVSAKDRRHVLQVSGDRRITDPATTATDRFAVTAVVAKKALTLKRSGHTLVVRGLAAKEKVTVTRGHTVVATGRADASGRFTVPKAHLKHGTYTAHGSLKQRAGTLRLR